MTDVRDDAKQRPATVLACEKRPARAAGGMVVTNHPLASAAGTEMLAAGGNAIDAAIAALFTLTVVEPMMVGILGGGITHIRTTDGRHIVLDGLSAAPAAAAPDLYRPVSDQPPYSLDTVGRENAVGPKAVATPGALRGWCDALERFGTMSLSDVMEPAIRHARRGFAVTPYLAGCIEEAAADLAGDPEIARLFLPDGQARRAGTRFVMGDYAETLASIASGGPETLYSGDLGGVIDRHMSSVGGLLTLADLAAVSTIERAPVRGRYRGFDIYGPPPPSAGGVHVIQMLNILEGYDLAALGYGSIETMHLLGEALKIAFADRARSTADPAFVDVPVDRLISKRYAEACRARISMTHAAPATPASPAAESDNTTHVTVSDSFGNIVSSTQTINSLFGARFVIPGTGIIPNNNMSLFDPHPGRALSIAPGKRVTTSMAPTIVLRDGQPAFALGLPGGLRIFGCVMQALVNLIDHGMSPQEAVEAPRLWTQGGDLEVEDGYPDSTHGGLTAMGWRVLPVPHVGGGMAAIAFDGDGNHTGAACWRADGVAIGIGGGLARQGIRFWPDAPRVNEGKDD